ncbi:protein NUCLEAR FUSION DEFECTIVE 2 [Malania oleifera]|uniref:protein NUCLEAR FUSION DEFECTIVE 2 n=1 Tax=Malania oleifera TaxID=397392 RepID=UPI0025AEB055|nr:protein NUCLEAR FUSION DEFECTIVE 2 [Malania oleifera]
MHFRCLTVLTLLVFASFPSFQARPRDEHHEQNFKTASPFSIALEALQKQIGYTFKSVGLLRRAMTHPSYSEENNKALSILGESIIATSVALRSLRKDVDTSAGDLTRRIMEVSKVDSSCSVDGMRLGLEKVIRVSSKTNSTTPKVVCGALRAIIGAVAVDTHEADAAGNVFWNVHGEVGRALSQ